MHSTVGVWAKSPGANAFLCIPISRTTSVGTFMHCFQQVLVMGASILNLHLWTTEPPLATGLSPMTVVTWLCVQQLCKPKQMHAVLIIQRVRSEGGFDGFDQTSPSQPKPKTLHKNNEEHNLQMRFSSKSIQMCVCGRCFALNPNALVSLQHCPSLTAGLMESR